MVLGEGPNWSRRVLSKKFKICDPPFYECHQIPDFDSNVELFEGVSNIGPGAHVFSGSASMISCPCSVTNEGQLM